MKLCCLLFYYFSQGICFIFSPSQLEMQDIMKYLPFQSCELKKYVIETHSSPANSLNYIIVSYL